MSDWMKAPAVRLLGLAVGQTAYHKHPERMREVGQAAAVELSANDVVYRHVMYELRKQGPWPHPLVPFFERAVRDGWAQAARAQCVSITVYAREHIRVNADGEHGFLQALTEDSPGLYGGASDDDLDEVLIADGALERCVELEVRDGMTFARFESMAQAMEFIDALNLFALEQWQGLADERYADDEESPSF